jgi:voltage-gated potassium channel
MNGAQLNSHRSWIRHRFIFLLVMLLSMLAVAPFLANFIHLRFLFNIFLSAVLVSAVYALSQQIWHLAISAALAIPMLVSIWSDYFLRNDALFLIGRICGIFFIGFTIFHILSHIFKQQEVTKDTIAGATAVYLLLALLWAFIYAVLDRLQPDSFAMSAARPPMEGRDIFIYYSLVTITTLGYGDITPASYLAGSMAALEAVVGQLYLVVLVSWLVGMYVSKMSKSL